MQIEAVYEEGDSFNTDRHQHMMASNGFGFFDDEHSDSSNYSYDEVRKNKEKGRRRRSSNLKRGRQRGRTKKLNNHNLSSSSHGNFANMRNNNFDHNPDFRNELFLESDSSFAYMSLSDQESEENNMHDPENSDYNDEYLHEFDEEDVRNTGIAHYEDENGTRLLQNQYIHGNQQRQFTSNNNHKENANHNTVLSHINFSYSAPSYPSYGSGEATSNSMHYGSSAGMRSFGSEHLSGNEYQHYDHPNNEHYYADDDHDDERMPMISKSHRRPSYGFGPSPMRSNDSFNNTQSKPKADKSVKLTKRRSSVKVENKRRRKSRHNHMVPPHMRESHAKARAITGRFLGLLRAEVDKICLFAHSRYGELTDTFGSLRFPFDQMEFGRKNNNHIGLHPSSSSSSDEGPNHISNSSHESSREEPISNVKPPLFPRARSDGNKTREEILSDEDDPYLNVPAYRQLKIAEELRIAKPIFQRSDYVLGEDFLLLSAVDEADAYTTVGVEFLHLLKFIVVNAIAVRRLCRKHDRLLASRMLGGYYHRLDEAQAAIDANYRYRSASGKNANSSFEKRLINSSLNPKQHRLTGVFDSIILGLANNSVAEDLSQSLHVALSEYEVARLRADALSGRRKKNVEENVADVGEEVTCYHFPRPKFAHSPNAVEPQDDRDNSYDALSTSSSISLTRLRFAVASVISLREAASESHESSFHEFLSRSMTAVNSSQIVGMRHGLKGCSKDALLDIAEYNPDLTLLHTTQVLKSYLSSDSDGFNISKIVINGEEVSHNGSKINSHTKSTREYFSHLINYSSIALTTVRYVKVCLFSFFAQLVH